MMSRQHQHYVWVLTEQTRFDVMVPFSTRTRLTRKNSVSSGKLSTAYSSCASSKIFLQPSVLPQTCLGVPVGFCDELPFNTTK